METKKQSRSVSPLAWKRVFAYLIQQISKLESTAPPGVLTINMEIGSKTVRRLSAPREIRRREQKLKKLAEIGQAGAFTKFISPTPETIAQALKLEREERSSLISGASQYQTELLWFACLLAKKLQASNKYQYVKDALGDKQSFQMTSTAAINMRVRRFEYQLERHKYGIGFKLGRVIEMADAFKRREFVQRTGKPQRDYPMRFTKWGITGLSDVEIKGLYDLLRPAAQSLRSTRLSMNV